MVFGVEELIDTLWNVNQIGHAAGDRSNYKLIDTLWNVNGIIHCKTFRDRRRINRYIMECKCQFTLVPRPFSFAN